VLLLLLLLLVLLLLLLVLVLPAPPQPANTDPLSTTVTAVAIQCFRFISDSSSYVSNIFAQLWLFVERPIRQWAQGLQSESPIY